MTWKETHSFTVRVDRRKPVVLKAPYAGLEGSAWLIKRVVRLTARKQGHATPPLDHGSIVRVKPIVEEDKSPGQKGLDSPVTMS